MSFEVMMDILVEYWPMFLRGTGTTLLISLTGTIIGTLIGLGIGVIRTIPVSNKRVKRNFQRILNNILAFYIEFFRGTPMIVQSMVIYYGLAQAFDLHLNKLVAAIIIVSINTGAYMAEIVRGGIVSVDKGQFEAAQAIGMSHVQTMKNVVLPQVIRNILPATGNEFVINIKDTSVLNVISVTELFYQTKSIAGSNYRYFESFAIVCIIYFILTVVITRVLRFVEKKMDGPDNFVLVSNQMQVERPEDKLKREAKK